MRKISIKREQSQAGLSFAERLRVGELCSGMREKFRPQVKNKLFLLLALLLTAATGAWAQTETLLTTITNTGENASFKSGSKTFDDIATVTFSNPVYNDGDEWGWYAEAGGTSLLTVAGSNGYTITRIKFYSAQGSAFDEEAPFEATVASTHAYVNGTDIGQWGVTKIEVYGYEGTAEPASAGYTVSLKDGVKDADKWTVKVGDGQAQALPICGLKGDGKETVTLQYTGRLKVKGVKATSEAAAEASVPDGALSGVFSVSDTKKVYFSKGNLQATYNGSNWSWAFATNQWDYIGNAAGNTSINGGGTISGTGTVDLFGWVGAACEWTGAAQYGISNVNVTKDYGNVAGEALKSDWGTLAITNGGNKANFGWHSLASSEWEYLFQTRTTPSGVRYAHATVNDVPGLVLLPDDWSTDYYSLDKVNDETGTAYTDNVISSSDWTSKLEAHGAVFLPAGGYRNGAEVMEAGVRGNYWSSTPHATSGLSARYFFFGSGRFAGSTTNSTRNRGCSVRLVQEATSGAPAEAKEPATVTTAPTGAAIVGVGKTTALVSGGVAEGGTMMYKVTTENTKPASTDGFSDAVPTAQTITASGKVYVWYYVKGDDTHSDSEIAATPIEVPVAQVITWNSSNVSDLRVEGAGDSYEKEGVTLSCNADQVEARWRDKGEENGIFFEANETGGFTFTAPTGKAFAKIEMKPQDSIGWDIANLGTWTLVGNNMITWTGSAASTVGLLTDAGNFNGMPVNSIEFYLVDAE